MADESLPAEQPVAPVQQIPDGGLDPVSDEPIAVSSEPEPPPAGSEPPATTVPDPITPAPERPIVILPTVGRIVHYVLSSGAIRPAIVIAKESTVMLRVFLNPHSEESVGYGGEMTVEADESSDGKPGTWHWPPKS